MIDYSQLAALRAIIQHGSFEAAAETLHVTASAISQRIKTLEDQVGSVLIIRGNPASATPAGQRLFRHAQEVALLESGLAGDLNGLLSSDTTAAIRIVVNADSLDTWFIHAMAQTDGVLFDVSTDDEGFSDDWLRRGEVMAAVTANAKPVQGCDSVALGSLRYLATASPDFAAQHFAKGLNPDSAKRAPMLIYNRKDLLQHKWLSRELERKITAPTHLLPSTHGFVNAAIAGLGWGLNPETLVQGHIAAGRLVCLGQNPTYNVPLFWQYNRAAAKALEPLTKSVRAAAQNRLHEPAHQR